MARRLPLYFVLLCFLPLSSGVDHRRTLFDVDDVVVGRIARRADAEGPRKVLPEGYLNPLTNGGSMVTSLNGTFPPGLGEPANVILSGNSDPAVLVDQEDQGGLRNYFLSIGFSSECLGQTDATTEGLDLGDGHGALNQTATIRWDYGNPTLGTCTETVQGGNHFRYWVQNGPEANTGAYFFATSYEKNITEQHDIIVNGYNLGRDWLVGNATAQSEILPTANLTNQSTYSGSTSFGGYTYFTSVQYVSGILQNTSDGINHFQSVATSDNNAIDGLIAVMTVNITAKPAQEVSATSSHHQPSWWLFATTPILLSLCTYLGKI